MGGSSKHNSQLFGLQLEYAMTVSRCARQESLAKQSKFMLHSQGCVTCLVQM